MAEPATLDRRHFTVVRPAIWTHSPCCPYGSEGTESFDEGDLLVQNRPLIPGLPVPVEGQSRSRPAGRSPRCRFWNAWHVPWTRMSRSV
jgi:hypothetical protein